MKKIKSDLELALVGGVEPSILSPETVSACKFVFEILGKQKGKVVERERPERPDEIIMAESYREEEGVYFASRSWWRVEGVDWIPTTTEQVRYCLHMYLRGKQASHQYQPRVTVSSYVNEVFRELRQLPNPDLEGQQEDEFSGWVRQNIELARGERGPLTAAWIEKCEIVARYSQENPDCGLSPGQLHHRLRVAVGRVFSKSEYVEEGQPKVRRADGTRVTIYVWFGLSFVPATRKLMLDTV